MVELLAPAGNWEMLRAAITEKADAVYLGVQGSNMRATARNFSAQELKKVVKLCHENNVRVYVTVNTIVYGEELKKVKKALENAKKAKVDGIICWDFSVIKEAKKLGLEIHISTQASISNYEALEAYYKLGARRFVLARELNLQQIKKIKKEIKKNKLKAELEVFIHGAMCVSVSGRCYISQFLFGKSANRGECLQPCRREYTVKDEEGKELKLKNNFVMSPKDLCGLEILDRIITSGVDVLKIEGRNRSPEYVKTTVSVYRKALELIKQKKFDEKAKKELVKELGTVYNRGFSTGFYLGKPINEWADTYGSKATTTKVYVGKILNYYKNIGVAEIKLETKGLKKGQEIMITGPTTGIIEDAVESIQIDNKDVKEVKKGEKAGIKIANLVRKNDKVFIIKKIQME